jgi:alpha-D-ribose 1-methylphosphonate 5-triphosphate diphosphatase
MGDDLLLTNARLVLRDETVLGTVLVIDGLIAEVDRDRCRRPGAIDLNGDYVVPGVVELHTDALDKHALPRPGMRWPETAAVLAHDAQLAAAGITTVLDSLAVGYLVDGGQRPMDPRPLAHAITRAQGAGLLRCEHFLHLRCEVSTEFVVEDVEPLAGDALVRLASLMDHSPG